METWCPLEGYPKNNVDGAAHGKMGSVGFNLAKFYIFGFSRDQGLGVLQIS